MRLLLLALFLLLASSQAMGADYYACDCQTDADPDCTVGSNSADGLTSTTPKLTIGAVQTLWNAVAVGSGGHTLSYCDGGAFNNETSDYELDCDGVTACTIGNYTPSWGTGDENIPIIHGNDVANHGIYLNAGSADQHGNIIIENIWLKGSRPTDAWYGVRATNEWDNITIRGMRISSWGNGIFPQEISAGCAGAGDCKNSSWTIEDNEIWDIERQGIGSGYSTATIQRNNIHDCGGSSVGDVANRDHCVYCSGCENVTFIDNDVWNCATDPWGAVAGNPDGTCSGTMVNFNGSASTTLVTDNTVENNRLWNTNAAGGGCYGIAIGDGSSGAEEIVNGIVRGNFIRGVGTRAIDIAACSSGCIVENNQIVEEVDNWGRITAAVDTIDLTDPDTPSDGVIIRYNSQYYGTGVSQDTIPIRVNTNASSGTGGFQVYGNAIIYEGTGDLDCFMFGQQESEITLFDNNACDHIGSSGSLTAWVVGVGTFPTHTTSANCDADVSTSFCANDVPVAAVLAFEDMVSPDYRLLPDNDSSELIDAGHATDPNGGLDILGKTRTATNDVGAYEYIATTDRFWVSGGSGSWTNTNNWSASSGGASGASVPDTDTIATFDANSGTGTATIDAAATVRDFKALSTSTITTLAFGTNTLTCERDCIFEDDAAITASAGAAIIAGRNLDTTAQDMSTLDNLDITLNGPGYWEYSPLAADNPDIGTLTTSQDGWTTTLKPNGAHTFGSGDINVHGQWLSGTGYLADDLTLETGSDQQSVIEFQNENVDFRHVAEFTSIGAILVEHEDTSGDRSVLQTHATYTGTSFDMTGNNNGAPDSGHLWMIYGDLVTTGNLAIEKTMEFDQNGYDITVASLDMNSNNGDGNWLIRGGAALISGRLRMGDDGSRGGDIQIEAGGSLTAGYLATNNNPDGAPNCYGAATCVEHAFITGAANTFIELTDATPGTCTTETYVDPDVAGPGAGTIGDPWNDWTNVEANLNSALDCVYIDKATTLDITTNDLIATAAAGTESGILGAYGAGASPILSLDAAEEFRIERGADIYEARFEFGFAGAVTTIFAPWLVP